MNVVKRVIVAVLVAMMLTLSLAEAVLAASAGNGNFAAEVNSKVYVALPNGGEKTLYSVPSEGGDLTSIETCSNITNLVMQDGNLYYIRYDGSAYQVVRIDAEGQSLMLAEFTTAGEEKVERLSWYDDMLYCLVAGKLTLVDPAAGDPETLSEDILIEDYVIVNDLIYYTSATDRLSYQKASSSGGADVTASAGALYFMDITATNPEKLMNVGVSELKAQGNYLYFRNFEDSYLMAGPILMGKLYRYDLDTDTHTLMELAEGYEWEYYPTPSGLIVYTEKDISIYPLTGGTPVQLMTPELYTLLCAYGDNAYVYEKTDEILTRLPVNGLQAVQLVGGATVVDGTLDENTDYTTEDDITTTAQQTGDNEEDEYWGDDEEEDEPTPTAKPTNTPKPTKTPKPTATPKATKKPTDSSYIFKDSNKKKLTRARILEVSKSKWPYARNEIYARHGYKFDTKKYADYFAKKSWYKPGGFSTDDLNSIEWYNMDLLKKMEEEYSSGDGSKDDKPDTKKDSSYIFANSSKKKLTEAQIKKVDKKWWPYARNEIYARHGYKFTTKKYADYFAKKSWYKPGGFSESDLNSIEWYNMDLLKKMEDK